MFSLGFLVCHKKEHQSGTKEENYQNNQIEIKKSKKSEMVFPGGATPIAEWSLNVNTDQLLTVSHNHWLGINPTQVCEKVASDLVIGDGFRGFVQALSHHMGLCMTISNQDGVSKFSTVYPLFFIYQPQLVSQIVFGRESKPQYVRKR